MKKNTKQNTQKTAIFKITGLRGVAILFAIIAVPVVLVILVNVIIAITQAGSTAIEHSKMLTQDQAKEFLQKQANEVSLPGEVVYEKITDDGCTAQGWIGSTTCRYNLRKYFRNSSQSDSDISAASSVIENLGWIRSADSDTHYVASFYGPEDNSFCKLSLFDKSKKDYFYDTAQKYLSLDKPIDMTDNDYIYGFDCYKQYK